ncbi:hypothetical protein H7X65_03080 [Candidatus Parcubacteria bacterium]|nr:hypothetical protein [Candidatus Parcubacteria bacterium]
MKDSYPYPLLNKISELYESKKGSFDQVYLLACQHLLLPLAKMFGLIHEFGIPKENIFILGKIYSTSSEIVDELQGKNFNIAEPIFDPTISFDDQHAKNCTNELHNFLHSISSPAKIIILDDGGALLKVVNDEFQSLPNVQVIGIEQTSSGFRKLEHEQIHFPIFNVARSSIKLIKESPMIADLGFRRINETIQSHSIKEPRILVVGLGPLGNSMLSLSNSKGYFTIGYDNAHHDKKEILDLITENNINIIIGVTGSSILNEIEIEEIKNVLTDKLYLISMSSADREFPAIHIRERGISSGTIHEDVVWGNLVLVNNGFPITFKGNTFEATPEEIETTVAQLYGSVLEAVANDNLHTNGFIGLPEKVFEIVDAF